MPEPSASAYGATRNRGANVSYAEVERAALEILAAGERPAVASVREKLGRGSAATIADALRRFWRDLGVRAQGDPAALTRLPIEIAESVESIWQRALALASQAARQDDNAARQRLAQLQTENELRAQSFALREKEYDASARARERALADSQEHLRTLMGMLEKDRLVLRFNDKRIAELEAEVEDYRRRLAELVARAVTRGRAVRGRGPAASHRRKPAARVAKTNQRRRGRTSHKTSRRGTKR